MVTVAMTAFAPCYLGGWTACGHWEITDQFFRDIVVMTSRHMRRNVVEIQGTRYRLKRVAIDKILRNRYRVAGSKPNSNLERIQDYCGHSGRSNSWRWDSPCRHVVGAYFRGDARKDSELLGYAGDPLIARSTNAQIPDRSTWPRRPGYP